jgi:hypothetical protein
MSLTARLEVQLKLPARLGRHGGHADGLCTLLVRVADPSTTFADVVDHVLPNAGQLFAVIVGDFDRERWRGHPELRSTETPIADFPTMSVAGRAGLSTVLNISAEQVLFLRLALSAFDDLREAVAADTVPWWKLHRPPEFGIVARLVPMVGLVASYAPTHDSLEVLGDEPSILQAFDSLRRAMT